MAHEAAKTIRSHAAVPKISASAQHSIGSGASLLISANIGWGKYQSGGKHKSATLPNRAVERIFLKLTRQQLMQVIRS